MLQFIRKGLNPGLECFKLDFRMQTWMAFRS